MVTALIIRKPTNLEQYHQLFAQRLMPAKPEAQYFECLHRTHAEHYACLDKLKFVLQSLNVAVTEADRAEHWPQGPFSYVIAFGGDGTLLTASYGIHDATPLIGVRSSSASVGYLCAADERTIESVMGQMVQGTLHYDERYRLKVRVLRIDGSVEESKYAALNDFLYAATSPSATSRYRIGVGSQSELHKSSGVWVATATGSSAAIAAAGGQALLPHDRRLQFLARELYHRNEDRLKFHTGLVDPTKETFWIENHCPSAMIALDGEKWVTPLRFGDRVEFMPGPSLWIASHPH